jgi:hypothetical protein
LSDVLCIQAAQATGHGTGFEYASFVLEFSTNFSLSAQILVAIASCFYGLVHVFYGPGEEASTMTLEYGAKFDNQSGLELLEAEKRKSLCFGNSKLTM